MELDGIYVCPHAGRRCDCRKPLPGLLRRAADDLRFNPGDCFVIGDKPCDMELGRAVQATTLVRTGYGARHEASGVAADFVVDDLLEAAKVIGRRIGASPFA